MMIKNRTSLLITAILITIYLEAIEARPEVIADFRGNLIRDETRYPPSDCCVIPTCHSPGQCFQTASCGYLCKSGKYPPATGYDERTPGYHLKESYTAYECRFGDCRYYTTYCSHCPDPRNEEFSIYTVRSDCHSCYYHQK